MGKTRDDEAYERGVRDGQRDGFLDDVIQANIASGSPYDEGYKYGATHRYGPEGRYHTWNGRGSNDPKETQTVNSGGGGSDFLFPDTSGLVGLIYLLMAILVLIYGVFVGLDYLGRKTEDLINWVYPAYETRLGSNSERVIRQKKEAGPMQERWEQFVSNSDQWLETPESPLSLQGKIIFLSSENGNGNIFLADPNSGKRPINLTNHFFGNVVAAAPSLDGKQIAFIANQKGESGIYVMNSNGTKITKIVKTSDGYANTGLIWFSPSTILIVRKLHPYSETIWMVEINHSQNSLAGMMIPTYQEYNSKWIEEGNKKYSRKFYSCASPAVSDDGELAYVTEKYFSSGLNSAFKTDIRLVVKTRNKPMSKSFGIATVRLGPQSWSPSGDKLVFHFSHTQNMIGILELREPGSGKYYRSPKIHWLDIIGKNPVWSLAPDGKGKAIDSGKNSTAWSSGRKQVNLTVPGKNPAWSPDGNWIAFDNEGTIYTVEVASGNVRKIAGPKLFGKSGTNPLWVQFEKTEKMEEAKQEAKEVQL